MRPLSLRLLILDVGFRGFTGNLPFHAQLVSKLVKQSVLEPVRNKYARRGQ